MVEPGLQVGAVQAELAPGLLQQRQGVAAGLFWGAESLQVAVFAEGKGGRMDFAGWAVLLGWVMDGKTPRRLKLNGGQLLGGWLVGAERRGVVVVHAVLSGCGAPCRHGGCQRREIRR